MKSWTSIEKFTGFQEISDWDVSKTLELRKKVGNGYTGQPSFGNTSDFEASLTNPNLNGILDDELSNLHNIKRFWYFLKLDKSCTSSVVINKVYYEIKEW